MARYVSAMLMVMAFQWTLPLFAQSGVTLGVNEQKIIDLDSLAESVNLSSAGVVEVNRGANKAQLFLKGKALGSADLYVKLADGRQLVYRVVVVDPAALGRRIDQVRKLLGSMQGVMISSQGSQIVLSGKVTNKATLQAISSIKMQYPGMIIDGTDKNLPEPNTVVTTINRVLADNDIGNIQAVAYGRILVLEGSAKDDGERELAIRIAKMISSDIEDRISKKSSAAPSINIEVMFAEVAHNDARKVGFQSGADKAVAGATIGGIAGGMGRFNWQVSSLTAFLQMLQTKSYSRVLSNPQIIGRSGEEATFHSGGTSYFSTTVVDDKGVSRGVLQEINHGIEVKVLPIVDRLGQIDVKLDSKVSQPVSSNAEGKVAEVGLTSLKTAVTLKSGQSVLLSGLVLKRQTKKVEKVPLLGDIPIIGELFKSREQNDEEKELLILVTMNRISASDQASDQASRLFDQGRHDVEFSIFD